MPRSSHSANVRSAICWPRFSLRKALRCCWQVTNSAGLRVAITTPIARTTKSVGSMGNRDKGQALTNFVRTLSKLKSTFSILRRGRFLKSALNEALQVKEITWINASGVEMQGDDLSDGNMRCFGMLLDGRAQTTGIKRIASDPTLLLVMNAYHGAVKFQDSGSCRREPVALLHRYK